VNPGGGSSSGSSAVEVRVVLLYFGWQEHWWQQQGRQCVCYVHQALAVLGQALYGVGLSTQCVAGSSSGLVVVYH